MEKIRILFVKLSAIGDVVQTLPALEAIARTFPGCEIDWVVEEAAAGILEGHPMLNRVLISKRRSLFRMLRHPSTFFKGIRGIREFVRELRRDQYDIAIDFQGLLKSGVLIGLARARRKIGFDRTRELSYLFLNERLPPYDIDRHALERYLDIARYLGAVDPSPICTLPIERERSFVEERLRAVVPETSKGRLVIINPVARWRTKLWSEERFAELGDRLVAERSATVIFTGGKEDGETIERITGMMRQRAFNWAGTTSLKELAALAERADLFITTDTGPMHLAAAAGGRVIALFGPTAPWRTGPHGSEHRVIRHAMPCSPCFSRTCSEGLRCMEAITVDDVMAQVS